MKKVAPLNLPFGESRTFTFRKKLFYLFQWKPFKMLKSTFYFIFKALFVLKIFKFLPWLFGHKEKNSSIRKKSKTKQRPKISILSRLVYNPKKQENCHGNWKRLGLSHYIPEPPKSAAQNAYWKIKLKWQNNSCRGTIPLNIYVNLY